MTEVWWDSLHVTHQPCKDTSSPLCVCASCCRYVSVTDFIVLNKMGVTANTQCGFCNNEKDRFEHIFLKCACMRRFWTSLESILKEKCVDSANCNIYTKPRIVWNRNRHEK